MQFIQFALHAVQDVHLGRQRAPLAVQPAESIQQRQVGARPQQGEVLPLAVDVDQRVGHRAQDGQADGAAVDAADITAVEARLAGQDDELFLFLIQPLGLQHRPQRLTQARLQPEGGLDIGLVTAGAHDGTVGTAAQHQHHRVEDDRLARARLAGQHVEAGIQLQA